MNTNIYSKQFIDDGYVTFSRDKQDRHAIDNIFSRKRNGYFVDVGASDGISENNTFLMEKYYDWNGLCCECDPRDIATLREKRTCNIIDSPIFSVTGTVVNFELHWANHLSGITGFQLPKYRSIVSGNVSMVTMSLNDCLKIHNAPHIIDYMSLDTEGTELDILSTFNFDQYVINYIAVEHNFQEPKRTNIKKLLEKHRYTLYRSIVCDDDYIFRKYATEHNIWLS